MKNLCICSALLFILFVKEGKAQDPVIIREYIEAYRELAIAEMQRTGVPAAIKLAQGIHETTAGTSPLVLKSNNHFGIKCKSTWKGESVSHTDDAPNECFRKYATPEDSYRDHSDFLRGNSRYAALFTLDPADYSGWAYGLKKAGYATNPKYPVILVKIIETYQLQDYTLVAMGKKEKNYTEQDAVASAPVTEKKTTAKAEPAEVKAAAVITAKPAPAPARVYPEGIFSIHNTKVTFARKDTPLLAIAAANNISLSLLLDINDMKETESLSKDQLIYLQRKRMTGKNEFHIVQEGETLHDIAQEEAIRLEAILKYNRLRKDMQPVAGEKLYLQGPAPAAPRIAGIQ
ncbi:MAG TPA: glucosaminidase domain-containing protein [Chitinophagaceae bacterium]|nr:glucosaminidase domain-containing protein [Chitinophagaceae bacterium]